MIKIAHVTKIIDCPECNKDALFKYYEYKDDISIECFYCDYVYKDGSFRREDTDVEEGIKEFDLNEINTKELSDETDYKKSWQFFKKDLLDIVGYASRFKNNDYDAKGIAEQLAKVLLYQMSLYENHIGHEPERTDYSLKGWHWGELADAFGIEEYSGNGDKPMHYIKIDDKPYFNIIEHFIKDNFKNEEVIETIKDHLRKMIRDEGKTDHYDAVWQGMLNIESDIVFMQFVLAFLGHMWT